MDNAPRKTNNHAAPPQRRRFGALSRRAGEPAVRFGAASGARSPWADALPSSAPSTRVLLDLVARPDDLRSRGVRNTTGVPLTNSR